MDFLVFLFLLLVVQAFLLFVVHGYELSGRGPCGSAAKMSSLSTVTGSKSFRLVHNEESTTLLSPFEKTEQQYVSHTDIWK